MVGVLVDPGLRGGCTVSTLECVVVVLVDPGLHGGSTDCHRTVWWSTG